MAKMLSDWFRPIFECSQMFTLVVFISLYIALAYWVSANLWCIEHFFFLAAHKTWSWKLYLTFDIVKLLCSDQSYNISSRVTLIWRFVLDSLLSGHSIKVCCVLIQRKGSSLPWSNPLDLLQACVFVRLQITWPIYRGILNNALLTHDKETGSTGCVNNGTIFFALASLRNPVKGSLRLFL